MSLHASRRPWPGLYIDAAESSQKAAVVKWKAIGEQLGATRKACTKQLVCTPANAPTKALGKEFQQQPAHLSSGLAKGGLLLGADVLQAHLLQFALLRPGRPLRQLLLCVHVAQAPPAQVPARVKVVRQRRTACSTNIRVSVRIHIFWILLHVFLYVKSCLFLSALHAFPAKGKEASADELLATAVKSHCGLRVTPRLSAMLAMGAAGCCSATRSFSTRVMMKSAVTMPPAEAT